MRKLTETRRQMLLNVRQGKEPLDGFEGSQLGGAMRSLQMLRDLRVWIVWDPKYSCWKLTEVGAKVLKTGEHP